jgi:hypothetical protein
MESPAYLSYLLRLWYVTSDPQTGWRASLQDAQTGKRIGFATLDDLFRYILEQCQVQPEEDERGPSAKMPGTES